MSQSPCQQCVMDNELNSRVESMEKELQTLKARIEELERAVSGPRGGEDSAHVQADLSQEDFLSNISMSDSGVHPGAAYADQPADEPVPDAILSEQEEEAAVGETSAAAEVEEPIPGEPEEDLPEDMPGSDEDSLFGPAPENITREEHVKRAARPLIDVKAARPAWLTDMPGTPVKDVRSAISLNDRVMFISTLFREDSMLFQKAVSMINAMSTMESVSDYLTAEFPEWNMNSDAVYRFMMAVRRKIR